MMGNAMQDWGWMSGLHGIFMILFWVLVVAGVVVLVRWLSPPCDPGRCVQQRRDAES